MQHVGWADRTAVSPEVQQISQVETETVVGGNARPVFDLDYFHEIDRK